MYFFICEKKSREKDVVIVYELCVLFGGFCLGGVFFVVVFVFVYVYTTDIYNKSLRNISSYNISTKSGA